MARLEAKVTRADRGRALTGATTSTPRQVVSDYLASHGRSSGTVSSLREQRVTVGANGVRHVQLRQEIDGLAVHGTYVKGAVNQRGELVQVIEKLVNVGAVQPNRVDAASALRAAMARLHPNAVSSYTAGPTQGNTHTFRGGDFFHSDPTVTAIVVPMGDGSLQRGWLVETWTKKTNQLHYSVVDGNGNVVDVENRTNTDRYNVFTEDPSKGAQTTVSGPAPNTVTASPSGWLGTGTQLTTNIVGNNVNAYLDADANNRADRGGTSVTNGDFLTAANLATAPTTTGNKNVSVQNLFYLNNVIHDVLYGHGFTESTGNFQSNNFGRGGAGADPVLAEAQDGSGTDNANFATPTDGKSPRMQMYLWTGAGATHEVKVNSPVNTTYNAAGAEFGPALTTTGITGAVVKTSPADGCTAISTVLTSKIALIDRGSCDFVTKVSNAQAKGATAVIMVNNVGTTEVFTMGGTLRLRIPAVMIGHDDGAALKAMANPNATERKKATQPLQIDASLDSDIVFHEYGHGLSWRMIGGMNGPIAGAIGEGNSDGIAMLINGKDQMAEYSASSPNGIRRYRYAGYPLNYSNVTGAEVHDDGEIYAAIVWRMIELFGTRRADLFGYVVDGMNWTPATPSFENMRDGILSAVAAKGNTADCGLVWDAFAQFGVGVGSSAVINSSTSVTTSPSFTSSTSCN